jgi:hypothetical protein
MLYCWIYLHPKLLSQWRFVSPGRRAAAETEPTQLGYQWLVASVEQFWPTAKTGRAVP